MSQRSVVEFNHDYAHVIDDEPAEFVTHLRRALASGGDRQWEPLRRYGLTRVVQLHHSHDRKVVTGFAEYPFG